MADQSEYWGESSDDEPGPSTSTPESPTKTPVAATEGFSKTYHIVITPKHPGGPKASAGIGPLVGANYLMPQVVKLGKDGKPRKTRDGRVIYEYLDDLNMCLENLVHKWASPMEHYGRLTREQKGFIDSIKTFMCSTTPLVQGLLVYHTPEKKDYPAGGPRDGCVTGKIPHLHIVCTVESLDGRKLSHVPGYKAIVRKGKQCDFSTSHKQFPADKAMGYFKRPNYKYLGSNSKKLGAYYLMAKRTDKVLDAMIEDEDDGSDIPASKAKVIPGFGLVENTISGNSDFQMITPEGNPLPVPDRKRKNPFLEYANELHTAEPDPFENPSTHDPHFPFSKKQKVETPKDYVTKVQASPIVFWVCKTSGATNSREVSKWVVKNREKVNEYIGHPEWDTKESLGQYYKIYCAGFYAELVKKGLELGTTEERPYESFMAMLKDVKDPGVQATVMTPFESAVNFYGWLEEMGHIPVRVIMMFLDILMKKDTSRNAVGFVGTSTIGKTFWTELPLQDVEPQYVGRTENSQDWTFMDCIDKLIVCMDEFRIIDGNVEVFKKVLRGTPTAVSIKNRGSSIMQKTPIIFSSNYEVTKNQLPANADAILNRVYEVHLNPVNAEATREWMDSGKRPHILMWKELLNYVMQNEEEWEELRDMKYPNSVEEYVNFSPICPARVPYTLWCEQATEYVPEEPLEEEEALAIENLFPNGHDISEDA